MLSRKDRHSFHSSKSLAPSLQYTSEKIKHRLCVKHLYENWRKKYHEGLMKEALYATARANPLLEFSKAMVTIKKLNEKAWKYMCDVLPQIWIKAAYEGNKNHIRIEILSRISCCHLGAYMWFNNHKVEDYIHQCYKKYTFLATYNHIILPYNGPKLCPCMRRALRRPKKLKRKINNEHKNPNKLKRAQATLRCKRH
ncbi:hypothetical protein CR513_40883, partial [Mucuna pruriens]